MKFLFAAFPYQVLPCTSWAHYSWKAATYPAGGRASGRLYPGGFARSLECVLLFSVVFMSGAFCAVDLQVLCSVVRLAWSSA